MKRVLKKDEYKNVATEVLWRWFIEDEYRKAVKSIWRDFRIYHRDNPHVYRLIVERVRWCLARGRHDQMRAIAEWLRNNKEFRTYNAEGLKFKLNCRWFRCYSVIIMRNEPDLRGYFNIRKERGHYHFSYSHPETWEEYTARSKAFKRAIQIGTA